MPGTAQLAEAATETQAPNINKPPIPAEKQAAKTEHCN